MINLALQVVHFTSGAVVLAEALNKIERVDIFDGRRGWIERVGALLWLAAPWHWTRQHILTSLKAMGWASLAVGAFCAVFAPLLHLKQPSVQDVAVLAGVALMIVRTRIKEGGARELRGSH